MTNGSAMTEQALRVDMIRCDGYGMCAELLPELVELDDWGFPMIRPGPVPAHLLDHARRAVEVCPVIALRLEASVAAAKDRPPITASQDRARRTDHAAATTAGRP